MSRENVEIVRAAMDAFNGRDSAAGPITPLEAKESS
jgi:hypothetical protein